MPRACTVCAHPERGAIDAALVAGEPNRAIARQHGLSKDAVARHREEHVPAALAKATEAADIVHADKLLDQVRSLQARTLRILATAEAAGELRTALPAIGQARGNLELLAKLLGELNEAPQINVAVSPEWVTVRTVVPSALAPYPDARVAVAARLLALNGRAS